MLPVLKRLLNYKVFYVSPVTSTKKTPIEDAQRERERERKESKQSTKKSGARNRGTK